MDKIKIISLKDYQTICGLKCYYDGYVWTPEGQIFSVETITEVARKPSPGFPYENAPGYTHRDSFFETHPKVTVTLVDIGNNCVLYDEEGNFLSVMPQENNEKGQIKICKLDPSSKFANQVGWNDNIPKPQEYDVVNIQDITLKPETYSKIFTHIVSLLFSNELKSLRNQQISVELYRENKYIPGFHNSKADLYNLSKQSVNRNSAAYYNSEQQAVAAMVEEGNPELYHLYSTIWNVLNILGVHELVGHGIKDWWDDDHQTHFFNYLYQMGHPTWKNTTKKFKEKNESNLNRYYKEYNGRENYDPLIKKNLDYFRSQGLYPPKGISGSDSARFNERISRDLQLKFKTLENPFEK